VAELGVSDYFLEVDGIRIQRFHNHAIRGTVAALLNLGIPEEKISELKCDDFAMKRTAAL
jgi:hypothetical protein